MIHKVQAKLPVQGKTLRFGVMRNRRPAASVWKVWMNGDDVYAVARSNGGFFKLSVHASGQIHYRLDQRSLERMCQPMPLDGGGWDHALELRFVFVEGADAPPTSLEPVDTKKVVMCEVPNGAFCCFNLLIQAGEGSQQPALPGGFEGAIVLWQAQRRDKRWVVMIARLPHLTPAVEERVRYLREQMQPTIRMDGPRSEGSYGEMYDVSWSPDGGNILSVMPLWPEAFQNEQDDLLHASQAQRSISLASEPCRVALSAPNGAVVAVLTLAPTSSFLHLVQGQPQRQVVCKVQLRQLSESLVRGSRFDTALRHFPCPMTFGGSRLETWDYALAWRFDGERLTVELRQSSMSLQNKNLPTPVDQLGSDEELVFSLPTGGLKLETTFENEIAEGDLYGRFVLRKRTGRVSA